MKPTIASSIAPKIARYGRRTSTLDLNARKRLIREKHADPRHQ